MPAAPRRCEPHGGCECGAGAQAAWVTQLQKGRASHFSGCPGVGVDVDYLIVDFTNQPCRIRVDLH